MLPGLDRSSEEVKHILSNAGSSHLTPVLVVSHNLSSASSSMARQSLCYLRRRMRDANMNEPSMETAGTLTAAFCTAADRRSARGAAGGGV